MLYHPVKIGPLELDGNLFLAPVAGYSDRAFRTVCVKGGANFCYTEMVSAEALTRGSSKTQGLMNRAPNEKSYAVQIFGGTEEVMRNAARLVLEKTTAECIDINGGCPVPKIIKSGAGSALTRNPEHLYKIVKAVVDSVQNYDGPRPSYQDSWADRQVPAGQNVPVTIKIRSGWDNDSITWKEAALAAIEAGAAAITIHPRTRAQGYEGKADWSIMAELVKLVNKRIPVFGSGDVFTPQDAKAMLEQTGCDGVMFARGAMGHPFIFGQTRDLITKGEFTEAPLAARIEAGFEELEILCADLGEEVACREMRKRFCAYSKGIEGGAAVRARIVQASTKQDYREIFANQG